MSLTKEEKEILIEIIEDTINDPWDNCPVEILKHLLNKIKGE